MSDPKDENKDEKGCKEDYEKDFSLIQTVYSIALVLGLEKVAESAYSTFVTRAYRATDYLQFMTLQGIVAFVLILLAIRFFAAPRNIRRFLINHPDSNSSRVALTFHLPILLGHAFVFYILCRVEMDITMETFWDTMPPFILTYCGLLIFNIVWLLILIRGNRKQRPEIFWIYNNCILVVLVLPIVLAWWYFDFSDWIAFAVIFLLFLLNSVIDLWETAESYFKKLLVGTESPEEA